MTDYKLYLMDQYSSAIFYKQPLHVAFEYSLQAMPLFWVWLASVFVWFFLELAVWEVNSFNTKHSYTVKEDKNLNHNAIISLLLLKNFFKLNILKVAYKLYV